MRNACSIARGFSAFLLSAIATTLAYAGAPGLADVALRSRDVNGIGAHDQVVGHGDYDAYGVGRRDPSDVIMLGSRYYVFYTKMVKFPGGDKAPIAPIWPEGYALGEVWYATSSNGSDWTEQGQALGRGVAGAWDSMSVFTPNIVQGTDGEVYLYYTGVDEDGVDGSNPWDNDATQDITQIGVARLDFDSNGKVCKTTRLNEGRPILSPTFGRTDDAGEPLFDSFRVDDAALLMFDYDNDGELEYGLYYKGRAQGGSPRGTQMGLAISDDPDGGFLRVKDGTPVQPEGHEVMVWAYGNGVASLASNVGSGIWYAEDGIHFAKVEGELAGKVNAPGAYRRELVDHSYSGGVRWGISMAHTGNRYLVRWVGDGMREEEDQANSSDSLETESTNKSLPGGCSLKKRPNIILFLVDDMGWQDTSVVLHTERTAWNDHYHTPHMQRLADRGMRFTNAYAASPVCTPTRVSIITGQNPGRSKVTDWTRQAGGPSNDNSQLLSAPWDQDGVQPGEFTTLPQLLSDAGYLTAHVGKAHFGSRSSGESNDPIRIGFDVSVGGSEIGGPYSYFAPFNGDRPALLFPGLQGYQNGAYLTDALTNEAIAIIDGAIASRQPFFVNLAHYAVHTPIKGQGDPDYLGNYSDDLPDVERHYAAMIESMDASLGAIIDHLEARQTTENTLILFMSDNGGLSNHTRANTSRTDDLWSRDAHNAPLLSGKGSAYEGGIRVPMIVAWAGQEAGAAPINDQLAVRPGTISHEPVHADDFFPTILSIAGVGDPINGTDLDGQDLTDLLVGRSFERKRGLFWHYPHQWYHDIGVGRGIQPFSAVRLGDFKLIYFYGPDGGDVELYNVAEDVGEQNNLAAETNMQAVLNSLRKVLRDWIESVDAQLPVDRGTGKAVSISALVCE